jgi:hypothetical protein
MAYNEIRNEYAQERFGIEYPVYRARLGQGDVDEVREKYKQRISIAEPDPGT